MLLVAFHRSPRAGKRYRMVLENPRQVIDFGQEGGFTYVDGATEKAKDAYLSRHKKREDWTKPNAGSASRWILWDTPDIVTNFEGYLKKMGIVPRAEPKRFRRTRPSNGSP
jgi:hypothetical protein